ncbi:hypothetical protein KGY77_08280 [Candidatus Bipolaricaulota bacterium]|nr:hypothetical protein [Candidatus Bipolaricaulota bacterium]
MSTELRRYFDYNDKVGVTRATVFWRVKNMAERADLTRRVYPHALRATCAFQLAEAGINAQGSTVHGLEGIKYRLEIHRVGEVAAGQQITRNKDKLW